MTATDTEAVTIGDLDWQPPCESKLGCDLPAVWVLQVSCCGAVTLLCTGHLTRWVQAERRVVAQGSVYCRECHWIIAHWDGFARWWLL